MNKTQRHEAAERDLTPLLLAAGWDIVLPLSTKSPADLACFKHARYHQRADWLLVEVKTGAGVLSKPQRLLKASCGAHYAVAHYSVVSGKPPRLEWMG